MKTLTHRIMQSLVPAPLRSASPHGPQGPVRRLRQRGFALGQALVVTAVLGGVSAVGTDWAAQQRQTAVLAAQNATYARINDAVGTYMTLYYPQLVDRTTYPDGCATLSATDQLAASRAATQCRFTPSFTDASTGASRNDYVINNILQPTLGDLQTLGLIDKQIPNAPLLPVNAIVPTGPQSGGVIPHDNVYGIMITRVTAGNDVNLNSLVYNKQPYTLPNADLSALLRMSNGAGASSGLPDRDQLTSSVNRNFDLKAYAGAWSRPNPVQRTLPGSDSPVGMYGIVAWRNGYDATATLQLTRRDGSLKPTADWDFNNKSITNINQVQAQDVTTGTLTAGRAVRFLSTLEVSGTVRALGDMFVSGISDLNTLVVHGPATFEQAATFQNNVRVNRDLTVDGTVTGNVHAWNINVENGAQMGAGGTRLLANGGWVTQNNPCTDNNALAQDANGRLLVCSSGSWQQATNNVYGLTQVVEGDSCNPEGSAAYLPSGLMAICRNGKWTPASLGTQVAGQACSVAGMMAAELVNDVANLLVCRPGPGVGGLAGSSLLRWSREIYARPKAEYATQGDACSVEQINAIARNRASDQAGTLMCTRIGNTNSASWQPPFDQYTENVIDKNEYIEASFNWEDYQFGGNGNYWGQDIVGPVTLKHWKNGVLLEWWVAPTPSWNIWNHGMYVYSNLPSGDSNGTTPRNFSRVRFDSSNGFNSFNPADWTFPIFIKTETGVDQVPDLGIRQIYLDTNSLVFDFYNPGISFWGWYIPYQLIMYRQFKRTYMLVK